MSTVLSAASLEEKKVEVSKITALRNKAKELETKRINKEQESRMNDYINAKVKGKATNRDIFFSVKDDFEKFAELKGGLVKNVYNFMDKMITPSENATLSNTTSPVNAT